MSAGFIAGAAAVVAAAVLALFVMRNNKNAPNTSAPAAESLDDKPTWERTIAE